jgi:colicin import membrane protein
MHELDKLLEHSGVKGMRWGVRKEEKKTGGRKTKRVKKAEKSTVRKAILKSRAKRAQWDIDHVDAKTGEYTNQSKTAKSLRVVDKILGVTMVGVGAAALMMKDNQGGEPVHKLDEVLKHYGVKGMTWDEKKGEEDKKKKSKKKLTNKKVKSLKSFMKKFKIKSKPKAKPKGKISNVKYASKLKAKVKAAKPKGKVSNVKYASDKKSEKKGPKRFKSIDKMDKYNDAQYEKYKKDNPQHAKAIAASEKRGKKKTIDVTINGKKKTITKKEAGKKLEKAVNKQLKAKHEKKNEPKGKIKNVAYGKDSKKKAVGSKKDKRSIIEKVLTGAFGKSKPTISINGVEQIRTKSGKLVPKDKKLREQEAYRLKAATNPAGAELDRIKKMTPAQKKKIRDKWKDVPDAKLTDDTIFARKTKADTLKKSTAKKSTTKEPDLGKYIVKEASKDAKKSATKVGKALKKTVKEAVKDSKKVAKGAKKTAKKVVNVVEDKYYDTQESIYRKQNTKNLVKDMNVAMKNGGKLPKGYKPSKMKVSDRQVSQARKASKQLDKAFKELNKGLEIANLNYERKQVLRRKGLDKF